MSPAQSSMGKAMVARNKNRIKSRVCAEKVAVALKSWNLASNADILDRKEKLMERMGGGLC